MMTLRDHLAAFRRAYYRNELLRGVWLALALVLFLGLSVVVLEGYFWFSVSVRGSLFYTFLTLLLFIVVKLILFPAYYLYFNTPHLSDENAARIIGRFFPHVSDRLLNALQLDASSTQGSELLRAAVARRTSELASLPFVQAVDRFRRQVALRYLGYALGLAALAFALTPTWISQGSYRLVKHNQPFQKPAPFQVAVDGLDDHYVEHSDVPLVFRLSGRELPSELTLFQRTGGEGPFYPATLQRITATEYRYTFEHVSLPTEFYLANQTWRSAGFRFEVLRQPITPGFRIRVEYPAYTGLAPDTLPRNQGDASVLVGSRLTWLFDAPSTTDTLRRWVFASARPDQRQVTQALIRETEEYYFGLTSTDGVQNQDTIRYRITAEPDRYPSLRISQPVPNETLSESNSLRLVGLAEDDFGIAKAEARFRVLGDGRTDTSVTVVLVPTVGGKEVSLESIFSLAQFSLRPGDEIELVVRVYDTDRYKGPKYTDSPPYRLPYLRRSEQLTQFNASSESAAKNLESLVDEARSVKEAIENLQRKLLDKKSLSYDDRQELQRLLNRQQELQEGIQKTEQLLQRQQQRGNSQQVLDPQSTEELEQLQDFLKQTQDPDYKEFVKELQENLERYSNRSLQNLLRQLTEQNLTQQQQLERTLELYRQWQAKQKTNEVLERIRNQRERQQQLQNQTEDARSPEEAQDLARRQEELAQEAEALKKELERLEELKSATQSPEQAALDSLQQLNDAVQQAQEESTEQLDQGKPRQSSKTQEGALQKLDQMEQRLSQMQSQQEEQQAEENYENLRSLLENLLALSFDQERLRDEISQLRFNDPAMNAKVQQQNKLRDDMQVIDDSLVALSKRVIQIKPLVLEELQAIRRSMRLSVEDLAEKQLSRAAANQHQVMTSLNTLANLMVESLTELQDQINQMRSGQGKPRPKGNPSLGQLIQQQMELNQELQEQLQRGEGQLSPEQQGQLAQEQEAIRRQLQELYQKLQNGEGKGGLQKALEEMAETEAELRAKELGAETLERQLRILNRLLDYDKSIREQEWDTQRQSDTGTTGTGTNPAQWDAQAVERARQSELLRVRRLRYAGYYQSLIDAYYNRIGPQQ